MFGGLTAYTRAPAEGVWESGTTVRRDDIIVVEVMVDSLDRVWWSAYRGDLERLFRQDQIVVRAQATSPCKCCWGSASWQTIYIPIRSHGERSTSA